VALGLLTIALLFPTLTYADTPQDVPAFFLPGGGVARVPNGDVAVIIPFIGEAPKTMLWQAEANFRYRMPSGYLFIPGPEYPLLFPPPSPLRNALVETESGRPSPTLDAATREAIATDLVRWKAHAVVIGPMHNRERVTGFMTELLRRPPVADGGVDVWWAVDPGEVR